MKRVDEDRWFASRFAPRLARERLVALYSVHYEIARIGESVSQSTLGDMRFLWWREALTGGANAHESLRVLEASGLGAEFAAALADIVAVRRAYDLDAAPFADLNALADYARATAGALIGLAARACDAELDPALRDAAGSAWGLIGAVRSAAFWRARGRTIIPRASSPGEVLERARVLYETARTLSARASAAAFPAFGYVAFAPLYMRSTGAASLFSRQWRLTLAAARGRI